MVVVDGGWFFWAKRWVGAKRPTDGLSAWWLMVGLLGPEDGLCGFRIRWLMVLTGEANRSLVSDWWLYGWQWMIGGHSAARLVNGWLLMVDNLQQPPGDWKWLRMLLSMVLIVVSKDCEWCSMMAFDAWWRDNDGSWWIRMIVKGKYIVDERLMVFDGQQCYGIVTSYSLSLTPMRVDHGKNGDWVRNYRWLRMASSE